MPQPGCVLMRTVCAHAVRCVALARVGGIHLAGLQQGRAVGITGAERAARTSLPRFLVLRVGLVLQLHLRPITVSHGVWGIGRAAGVFAVREPEPADFGLCCLPFWWSSMGSLRGRRVARVVGVAVLSPGGLCNRFHELTRSCW